jgi:hypothetical protein
MDFSFSKNSARQIPQNDNIHRPRRLNLAKLNSNQAILILQLNSALSN